MPIKKSLAERKGSEGILYFHGTVQEAKKVMPESIQEQLKQKGISLELHEIREIKDLATNHPQGSSIHLITTSQGPVSIKITRTTNKNGDYLRVHQQPFSHNIYGTHSLEDLIGILKQGFRGTKSPNVIQLKERKDTQQSGFPTSADTYAIELMSPGNRQNEQYSTLAFVKNAMPQQILRVKIRIGQTLSEKERENRRQFYKMLLKKHGVPITFE